MSEEQKPKEVIRPFVVDGIEEYDNPMPSWWTWMFLGCIAFGVTYLLWVHGFGWNSIDHELSQAVLDHEAFVKEQNDSPKAEGQAPKSLDDKTLIAEGQTIFQANCVACHGSVGEGGVGPNLTDNFWLHGGKPENVLKVIAEGVPAKGMLSWQPILGTHKVAAAAAYVLSLKGTKPQNAKAPQGEEDLP